MSEPDDDPIPAWVPCDNCDEWYCTIHGEHVHDCPCPPIDEWEYDPYVDNIPPTEDA